MHVSWAYFQNWDKFFNQNFSITQPKALEGVFAPNKFLERPDILYKGMLQGPEHILMRDGVIYTSLGTGEVVKIIDGKVEVMSQFGKYCCESQFVFK